MKNKMAILVNEELKKVGYDISIETLKDKLPITDSDSYILDESRTYSFQRNEKIILVRVWEDSKGSQFNIKEIDW